MEKFKYLLLLLILLVGIGFSDISSKNERIRVGVYGDLGASSICVTETMAALKIDRGIEPQIIKGLDIAKGILKKLDVIVFPGGSGSKEASSMGSMSREKIRDFIVNRGKACVGICAGGYLLSSTPVYKWSLRLTSSTVFDRAHYNRGRGLIELSLTDEGKKYFPELSDLKSFFLQYYDGPVLVRETKTDLPDYSELAKYVTDIHLTGGSKSGVTPGKTALLLNNAGKGKVFVVIGHPEATPGMRWMIPRMVRIVTGKKRIAYPREVVRPKRYNKPILFDSKRNKREKVLFWKIVGGSEQEKLDALKELTQMRSRASLRWAIGLLRDKSVKIRAIAANVLSEAEYTPAIDDLEIALKTEKDKKCAEQLKRALLRLKQIIGEK